MPIRRTKACDGCRLAKARCSLTSPSFLRCSGRGIQCHYTERPAPDRNSAVYRAIQPAPDAGHVEGVTQAPPAHVASQISSETEISNDHLDFDFASLPFELDELLDPCASSNLSGLFDDSAGGEPSTYDVSLQACAIPELPSCKTPHMERNTKMDQQLDPREALRPQLSHRARSLQQGSLTAKMLSSKLVRCTRRMGDSSELPTFIFPPCALGSEEECEANKPHQCLPAQLAICANLTKMFYARSPGSHRFVWQQILSHLRQMECDVSV